jgi:hypothetical protein
MLTANFPLITLPPKLEDNETDEIYKAFWGRSRMSG